MRNVTQFFIRIWLFASGCDLHRTQSTSQARCSPATRQRRCSLADEKLLARSHVGCCFTHLMNHRLMIWACAFSFYLFSNARSDEATSTTAPTNLVPSWETQRQAATYAL